MANPPWDYLIAPVVAVIAALLTYIVAKRRLDFDKDRADRVDEVEIEQGRLRISVDESAVIVDNWRALIDAHAHLVEDLREQVEILKRENAELREAHSRVVFELREQIDALKLENERLRERITKLEHPPVS
jgi:hypothetical protein